MKTAKWCLIGTGIFLVLATLTALMSNIIFGHQLRKTLTTLQAEGRSTTIAELGPATVSVDQNAAPLFEKAALVLTNRPVSAAIQELSEFAQEFSRLQSQNRALGLRDMSESRRERLMHLIEEPDNKALYAILSEAAHKPGYIGHYKLEGTAILHLPFLEATRQLMGFLVLKAEAAAYRGNSREAGQALLDGFHLAGLLKQEAYLVQLLVSEAYDVIQMNSLYRITNGVGLPADILQSLEAELKAQIDAAPYARAMDAYRITALEGYQTLLDGTYRDVMTLTKEIRRLPPAYFWLYRTAGLLHRDMTVFLTLQARIQDKCRMPLDKNIASVYRNPIENQIPAFCPLSRLMLKGLDSVLIAKAEYEAKRQVTRVGLALKRYKMANGVYPGTLTSLTPSFLNRIPKDPWGGNSLQYRKEGEGFLLYSVGRDLQDNQGAYFKPRSPFDIAWKAMR